MTSVTPQNLCEALSLDVVLGSFLACWVAYFIVDQASPIVFPIIFKKILSDEDKLNWNNRIVSAIHSVISAQGIIRGLMTEALPNVRYEFEGTTEMRQFYLAVTMGYCLHDMMFMFLYRRAFKRDEFLINTLHHLIIVVAYSLVMGYTYGTLYASMFQAIEASNLFMHLRWFLYKAEMKTSKYYLANGIALVISYFIFRVGWNSAVMYRLWKMLRIMIADGLVGPLCMMMVVVGVSFALMQYYFFYLVFSGFLDHIRKSPPASSASDGNNKKAATKKLN